MVIVCYVNRNVFPIRVYVFVLFHIFYRYSGVRIIFVHIFEQLMSWS